MVCGLKHSLGSGSFLTMSLLVAVGGEKIFYLGSGEKVEAASKYMNFKVNIYTEILPEEMLLTNPG